MNLSGLVFWHWWILALVLLGLELFAPTGFFIWCGIAAGVVGVVLLLIPALSWQLQLLLFAVLAIISVLVGRKYLQKRGAMISDQPMLNRRGEQYVGRIFTLDEAIVDGTGRVQVDDSSWRIEGQNMAAGSRIKVIAVSGSSLIVERTD